MLIQSQKVEFDIFEFESEKEDIVEQAINMLQHPSERKGLGLVLHIVAVTWFFTGLRGSELRHMFEH